MGPRIDVDTTSFESAADGFHRTDDAAADVISASAAASRASGTVYDENGLAIERVDLTGKTHNGIPTPHTKDYVHNTNPGTGVAHANDSDPDVVRGAAELADHLHTS